MLAIKWYQRSVLLALSLASIFLIPASPIDVPKAAAVTTVCNTNVLNWFNPTQDFSLHVLLRTCGTGSTGTNQFSSTSHNATVYCTDTQGFLIGCTNHRDADIFPQSWTLNFLGQFNQTTVYSSTFTQFQPVGDLLTESVSSFQQPVDFAMSYANFTFLDCPPGPTCFGPFTFQVESFVGTYTVFEMDWSDYNNDGAVGRDDLDAVQAYFGQQNSYWDLNLDGTVDVVDVATVAHYYGMSFNNLPFFPGQGCSAYTFNNAACQPLDSPSISCRGSSAGSCFAVHPKWKDSCAIFPQPDQNYCLQRTPS